jgi:hypothetical protein
MKTKIITIRASIAAILLVLSLANCKPDREEPAPTLKSKIKGKTYVLGTVRRNIPDVDVTIEFAGLMIVFDAVGEQMTITCDANPCLSGTYPFLIDEGSSAVSGTAAFRFFSPTKCFMGTAPLFNAGIANDESSFFFWSSLFYSSIVINPGRTSSLQGTYIFNLVKQ